MFSKNFFLSIALAFLAVLPSHAAYRPSGFQTTLTFTTNNFGTVTNSYFMWRRIGDSLEVIGSWTNGSPGSSSASLTLPFEMDTTKLGSVQKVVGQFFGGTSGTNTIASSNVPFVFYDGSDGAKVYLSFQVGVSGLVKNNADSISNGSQVCMIHFRVPIRGWSN